MIKDDGWKVIYVRVRFLAVLIQGDMFKQSKPSCHYMYRQFNIQQFCVLPTQCIYVFCVDLRTNSDYFTVQHKLTGFYNRDGKCLLRGTNWVFK